MIDIDAFLKNFVVLVQNEFGDRLWFLGLQGSYARGEATDCSDLDIVVILDKLHADDIKRYNRLLDAVSCRNLMCGFLSGKDELLNWNASELFQFYYDTKPIIGSLEELFFVLNADVIKQSIKNSACSIYHACIHNMLYEKDESILASLYKSACFVIQAIYFQQSGKYISRKSDLIKAVDDENGLIVNNYFNENIDFMQKSDVLLLWAQKIINHIDKDIDYKIVPYEEKYHDDLIFMILEAKDALGKVPSINSDLFDVKSNYFDNGDMFWLAVDDNDRVIGSVSYSSIEGTNDVWLHRLYIKKNLKRSGIGSALLVYAENFLESLGKNTVFVHLGDEAYFESRQFYPKHGYEYYADRYMKKVLCTEKKYSHIIGMHVSGVIDRPLGSSHPEYSNMIYPVNYGYIPAMQGGDGEAQDVYFLGSDVPLESFSGKVIAVFHRINDNEDKWIVAESDFYTDDEIIEAIHFQEKYFNGRLYR